MKPINIGIDLGTTNSLIAVYHNGQVNVIKNPIGFKDTLPSVVGFRNDRIIVGDKAREYLQKDAVNVFGEFKRKMGTEEKYYIVNLDENTTPVELSSYVLKELLRFNGNLDTEAAVITIPASFDTVQSNATKQAGIMAGIKEVFLLQEPIAASLAYLNSNNTLPDEGFWLVYDLGGGTFDIALIKIKNGELKVVDHEGDNYLGGKDFDAAVVEKILLPEMIRITGITDLEEELFIMYGKYEKLYLLLLYKAEEAKKELSIRESTTIDFSTVIDGKEYYIEFNINRDQLNEIIADFVNATIKLSKSVLERNNLLKEQIQQIIMIGGSTFIPYVRETLFNELQIPLYTDIDPTTSVAIGAAYYASTKLYQPIEADTSEFEKDDLDELIDKVNQEAVKTQLVFNYNTSSNDLEEVLIGKVDGDCDHLFYRIIRADSGFDTGLTKLKSRFTEFLPLLPGVGNVFHCKVYDANNQEIVQLKQEIIINQGQFNVSGQPLPNDICIEVDDMENKTTKLEVIFERNSILPLKKTLYREVSHTIKQKSKEQLIIHILEGDRNARPDSLLSIANIEIKGENLNSDLIKGSDVEIQISISESREISVNAFLVMTKQEFKNVFSMTDQHVNLDRLRELFNDLERDIKLKIKEYSSEDYEVWSIQLNSLLDELLLHKEKLMKLKSNDRTDAKYAIASSLRRISQQYDQIGGDERIQLMIEQYLDSKEYTEQLLAAADTNKDSLETKYKRLCGNDSHILKSRTPSLIENKIKQLSKFRWEILWNTNTHLISIVFYYKSMSPDSFNNYKAAQMVIEKAEKSIEEGRFIELKQNIITLSNLEKSSNFQVIDDEQFKGTGLG